MNTAKGIKSLGQIIMILGTLSGILFLWLSDTPNYKMIGAGVLVSSLFNGLLLLGFGIAIENLVQIREQLAKNT